MKFLVFLLALANLLFYAFSAGYFGQADSPDAQRLNQQVRPEQMRIVSRGEMPATAPPVVGAQFEAAVESRPARHETEAAPVTTCLRWDHLSVTEAERLSALFADKFSDFSLNRQNTPGEGGGWWVYLPPLPGKAEADKKAAELRGLGVADYFLIQDGPNRFAISLGIFSSEKGAQERLAELKAKGVRTAKLAQRPGKEGTVALRATGPEGRKAGVLAVLGEVFPKLQTEGCK